jgi:hypothetical protein
VSCFASCPGELPVGVKPLVLAVPPPGATTATMTAATPATTATAPRVTTVTNFRDLGVQRAPPEESHPHARTTDPLTGGFPSDQTSVSA